VQDRQRYDIDTVDAEWLFADLVQLKAWDSWIAILVKNIRILNLQLIEGVVSAIYGHNHILKKVISPDIIQASCMVAVGMGKYDCIHTADIFTQHLLSEIRTGVNNKTLPSYFYPDG
jgi:hypothetical protein